MKCERCDALVALIIDDGFESALCVDCLRRELHDLVYAAARVFVEVESRAKVLPQSLHELRTALHVGGTMKVLRHVRQDLEHDELDEHRAVLLGVLASATWRSRSATAKKTRAPVKSKKRRSHVVSKGGR